MIVRTQAAKSAKTGASATAAPERQPARFTICVPPFANMSGDQEQEYFSDSITEDIITDLRQVSALAVISRNSASCTGQARRRRKSLANSRRAMCWKGACASGRALRISAQLIDGATNNHIWAERYDRDTLTSSRSRTISAAIVKR
jgi:adenylate cyclase